MLVNPRSFREHMAANPIIFMPMIRSDGSYSHWVFFFFFKSCAKHIGLQMFDLQPQSTYLSIRGWYFSCHPEVFRARSSLVFVSSFVYLVVPSWSQSWQGIVYTCKAHVQQSTFFLLLTSQRVFGNHFFARFPHWVLEHLSPGEASQLSLERPKPR